MSYISPIKLFEISELVPSERNIQDAMYNASIQIRKYATKLDTIRKLVNEKDEE